MKGATLTILTKWENSLGNEKSGKDPTTDKWIAWRKQFENTFNCKLVNKTAQNSATWYAEISPKLKTGEYYAGDTVGSKKSRIDAVQVVGFNDEVLIQQQKKKNSRSCCVPYAKIPKETNDDYQRSCNCMRQRRNDQRIAFSYPRRNGM